MAKVKENSKTAKETPLMKQYNSIKAKHPNALLLFRVGDFYETFGSDAVKTAQILGIVLTKRANGSASHIELAGFPHHALDTYLPKLVRAGQRVAICDQLEDPKLTKKIVKRGVTELVTPGVALNDKVLNHNANNFLASVFFDEQKAGVAFLDISTGEFFVAEGGQEYIEKLIQGFKPSEVLFQKDRYKDFADRFGNKFYTYGLDEWVYTFDFGYEKLIKHFETQTLKGYGVEGKEHAIIAAGAILHYLAETQHNDLKHISGLSRIEQDQHVWLDHFTIRNLELLASDKPDAVTLIDVLDKTVTPMGSRMLKRWLVLPLKQTEGIQDRLDMVEYFYQHADKQERIGELLKVVGDLERIVSKAAVSRIGPRELLQLNKGLEIIPEVKKIAHMSEVPGLQKMADRLSDCEMIRERISKEIDPGAPAILGKGKVIADGVSAELDEYRSLSTSAKEYLESIKERESERTGIPSLKIAYNNVFGYYIEVRNTHKDKVPEEWIRKQTLVNAERYITEELKEFEGKILSAEEKISTIESQLYTALVCSLLEHIPTLQLNAQLLSRLDCVCCFAHVAERNGYVRPTVDDSYVLDIKEGRHPVIEQNLPLGEKYISNDTLLDKDQQQIIMVTGPNMSGKSALLRQTALIVLMAQMGCFVPAKSARIGLVDKVFTRVGASDNISSGESTFMVEMNEAASILNNLSDRSLILLDEIGRGTSTYDGISIAWAIAEYLHENKNASPKTLFATHYHELNQMAEQFGRIKNFNVSVKEVGNRIIFVRKLVEGGSEHSFGIHVAKLAGMPTQVLKRAESILSNLEEKREKSPEKPIKSKSKGPKMQVGDEGMQLSFIQLDDPVLEQMRDHILSTDINSLTPVEALNKLNEIKELISK